MIWRNPKCDRDRIKKELKKKWKRMKILKKGNKLKKVQLEKGNNSPNRKGK